MLITVDGLVISRRNYSDTSCYIGILTKEFGVVETLAKGVRRLNSPLSQATGLFAHSEFCFNKNSNLNYTINSAKCKHSFHELSADLRGLALAAYFAELVRYTQPPEQSSGNVLKLLLIALTELEHGVLPCEVKVKFEFGLICELGFAYSGLEHATPRECEEFLLEQFGKGFKTLNYYKSL